LAFARPRVDSLVSATDLPIVSACSFLRGRSREGIDPDPAIGASRIIRHRELDGRFGPKRNAPRKSENRERHSDGDTLPRPRLTRDPLEPYLIKPIPAPTPGLGESGRGGTRSVAERAGKFHLHETIPRYRFINTHHRDCATGDGWRRGGNENDRRRSAWGISTCKIRRAT